MSYLKTVVQHLNDSVTGLKECSKLSHDDRLNHFLIKLSEQRKDFSRELTFLARDESIDTKKQSIAGSLHNLYIQLKSIIKTEDLEDIKREIIRGDRVLIESYNDAIMHEKDEDIKFLLSQQLHSVHQDLVAISHQTHLNHDI
ncbi:MAG TPA: DUF2383 domain-containing protein [Gammaproteobacteria bacterium]|jgi:uncharacterized protein (TIGR02284 family)|nr:DUF2383 domain-containing protein [Gammaproteobacteria bacterium]